jgi:hypothetical protein
MSGVITSFIPQLKENEEEYELLQNFLSTFWKGVPLIDDALDRLKLSEDDRFHAAFMDFIDEIQIVDTKLEFVSDAKLFAERYHIELCSTCEQEEQLENLYECMLLCDKLDLLPQIKEFSDKMVIVSKEKREAQTAQEIIMILEDENKAISKLFETFLSKFKSVDPESHEFKRMSEFLFLGEQVRNVFDDLVDARADKKRGEINLKLNFNFYRNMVFHWAHNLWLMEWRFGRKIPIIFTIILKEYCGNIWMNRKKKLSLNS